MNKAAWLSHLSVAGVRFLSPKSLKRQNNKVTSQELNAVALYSAEDLATTYCFLDFHDTGEAPNKMQNLVVDLLEVEQLAQSESK